MKTYRAQLFDDIVPSKQRDKKRAYSKAYRIAKKMPEAVLKVISWGHSSDCVMKTLMYVSRQGELTMEDPQGSVLDADQVRDRLAEWETDFDAWKKNSRESMHMMFSSPKGSDREAVLAASRRFATDMFPNHDYLLVRHDDTDFPHVHFVVKARGFDLTKLNPGRKDLRVWREHYAVCLRERGVQVEASKRLERGLLGRAPLHNGTQPYLRDTEPSQGAIKPVELSSAQKRYLKRSQAYQRAFEAIGQDLMTQGDKGGDKRLLGMGEAIQAYAKERHSQQMEDVQRLYFAKRQLDKGARSPEKQAKDREKGVYWDS